MRKCVFGRSLDVCVNHMHKFKQSEIVESDSNETETQQPPIKRQRNSEDAATKIAIVEEDDTDCSPPAATCTNDAGDSTPIRRKRPVKTIDIRPLHPPKRHSIGAIRTLVEILAPTHAGLIDSRKIVVDVLRREGLARDTPDLFRQVAADFLAVSCVCIDDGGIDGMWKVPLNSKDIPSVDSLLSMCQKSCTRSVYMHILRRVHEEDPDVETLVCMGDEGLGVLLAMALDGMAFSTGDSPTDRMYMYDDDAALWIRRGVSTLTSKAGKILRAAYGKKLVSATQDPVDLSSHAKRANAAREAFSLIVDRTGTRETEFNRIQYLIPVLGGLVIDLRTGKPRRRTIEDMFTWEMPVKWNPLADQSRIRNFLRDISCGNEEKARFHARLAGYYLVGDNPEHLIFVCIGRKRNGKSTWMKLLSMMMGPFAIYGKKSIIMETRSSSSEGPMPFLTSLNGSRLAIFTECKIAILIGFRIIFGNFY